MMQEGNTSFTARSVLASALLGEDPPELPVAHLVHLVGLFGINENRARVALSRMVAAGEVTTDGDGRYRLAGRLLDRQLRQHDSRLGRMRPWGGAWRMAVVITSGSSAEERATRRKRLVLARLAEQREGVWIRPDNIDLRPDPANDPDLALFRSTPDEDPVRLAAHLWNLRSWAERASELCGRMHDLATEGPSDLAPGFELSAAVLRHLQADPLLPTTLLPPDWPGAALREQYSRWDRQYRHVLRAWSSGDRAAPHRAPARGPVQAFGNRGP
jgi:phenylacetic acid degradation operon negative regulatory protein